MFFSYTGEGQSVAPRLVRAMGETDLRSTNEAAHTHNASFDHTKWASKSMAANHFLSHFHH